MYCEDEDTEKPVVFNKEQLEVFEEAFSMFETNGFGVIHYKHVFPLLRDLAYNVHKEEAWYYMNKLELSEKRMITLSEVIKLLEEVAAERKELNEVPSVYNVFDPDQKGRVALYEIHDALSLMYGQKITEDEVSRILSIADEENTGFCREQATRGNQPSRYASSGQPSWKLSHKICIQAVTSVVARKRERNRDEDFIERFSDLELRLGRNTALDTVLMSFLSVRTVYLDSKWCLKDKTTQPQEIADGAVNFSPKDAQTKANDGKENKQEKKFYTCKPVTGSNDWRYPRKEKSKGNSVIISPVLTNSSTLIKMRKGDGKTGTIKTELSTIQRSSSTLGCSYERAKITKQRFRLPCIPDVQALSINAKHPIKALFVEGKKLGSRSRMGSSAGSNDKNQDFPKTYSKRIMNNNTDSLARKPIPDIVIEGKKDRHHADWYDDAPPAIKKADFLVKSTYTSSSKIFNTSLQSRFGKSVYKGRLRKTGVGGDKTFQVYWAPVLIKRKVLNYRTTPANCYQENRGDAISVEEVRRRNQGEKNCNRE
ncbi:Calmodulin [Stylophora pistillata]|uniref:Calmodulin n=1 Tax=Stylophora pistillata TaxID=50429 RepID=A0A2B4RI21_STYPI|nr:Calmodulin [Stylophora pistillata]